MVIFKINLEVILASEQEIDAYYKVAAKKINLLLEKYDIRAATGKFEEVSSEKLRQHLTANGFFQATPLKSIFYDQKQSFVPPEIIQAFRGILCNAPINLKAIFYDAFIKHLIAKGWGESFTRYVKEQYSFPSDGVVILEDLTDFSLGFGVYKATFQLRDISRRRIVVFLKLSDGLQAYNQMLYFYAQKTLLATASHAPMPTILSSGFNDEKLLLTPLVPGITSDTLLSMLVLAYRDSVDQANKVCIKQALEMIIEAFIEHAVLGDLLGRNDRHLMNSLIALVMPQDNNVGDLYSPENILSFFTNKVKNKTADFSLIDIDLKWLLDKKNADWALVDIDFGLSELNLLSLLPEFNDYDSKSNSFLGKRKQYLDYYFNLYCQKQVALLDKKELLFSAVKKFYPQDVLEEKLDLLAQRISHFEKNKDSIVEFFKRYLLNYRIRLIYKRILHALVGFAKETNNTYLWNALKETDLLKYLPFGSALSESSVFTQLQCFRGVLAKEDMQRLCEKDRMPWETVAFNIATIAEKFNHELFAELKDKIQFVMNDTIELVKFMQEKIQLGNYSAVSNTYLLVPNNSC